MKTAVYQSFRVNNVPPWITTCLKSASAWAKMKGFDYLFYGDEFFDYTPADLRSAVKNQRHLVLDIARLELAHELLATYDRVIWIDADVYINNPELFLASPSAGPFLFCKEEWVYQEDRKTICAERVNNAVMVLDKGNPFLDFYRYSCRQVISEWKELSHSALGTIFLTRIHKILKQPLLHDVGIFSPLLLGAAHDGQFSLLDIYLKREGQPVHAANLCLTFLNSDYDGRKLDARTYESAIAYLDTLS